MPKNIPPLMFVGVPHRGVELACTHQLAISLPRDAAICVGVEVREGLGLRPEHINRNVTGRRSVGARSRREEGHDFVFCNRTLRDFFLFERDLQRLRKKIEPWSVGQGPHQVLHVLWKDCVDAPDVAVQEVKVVLLAL